MSLPAAAGIENSDRRQETRDKRQEHGDRKTRKQNNVELGILNFEF
ncbi:MAG: hypothetical protein U5K51_11450 [Flavobacteriaceae bacterium]|nr:hypothetical protein [Flavobacteriaceae bacterium]